MPKVEIKGLSGLTSALDEMGHIFKRDTVVRAQRLAMRPCVAMARAKCPRSNEVKGRRSKKTGKQLDNKHLVNSIGTRALPGGEDVVQTSTGPRSPHGHLVEFGHKLVQGRGKNKGKVLGTVPPHPFMRPAWDATGEQCLRGFGDAMRVEIEKTMKRLNAKIASDRLTVKEYRSLADA